MELFEEVSGVVATVAKVQPPYTDDQHLYNDLGLESVQALNLLLSLEERFGVSLDDQHFVRCRTVAALADLVRERRSQEEHP